MTTGTIDIQRYLHQKKPLWNRVALLYTLIGYGGGIALLLSANGGLNALGVVWLIHSLVISAYLSHELMHGTIFEDRAWNVAWGNVMLWLNGSCYARFGDLMRLHIAHHVDRVDFCRFDLAAYLKSLPAPVQGILLGLEWLYVPSLAFLLRIRSIVAPFWDENRKNERWRVVQILLIRVGLFTLLGIVSLKALLLYFLAYVGMLNVLRVMDAFQHTYEVYPIGMPLPKYDQRYEQANTFSPMLSKRYGWLNLLMLNFGYHNAHHELMKCPWHSLPELDQELFAGTDRHYILLSDLLKNYHRYRVSRIYLGQGQAVDQQGNRSMASFYGAIEVSFLVLPA